MLAVLGAISELQDATLVKIVARTGLDKKSVTTLIAKAINQACVSVRKSGPIYTIDDWGPVIKKDGARKALTGALRAPTFTGMTTEEVNCDE